MLRSQSVIAGAAAVAVLLAACGSDTTAVSESVTVTEAGTLDETTAESPETTEPETTEPETTEAQESGSPEEVTSVSKSGFSTYDSFGQLQASAGALVVNNSDEDLFGTEVTFNFIGADGTPVGTTSTYIDVIPAGDSFPAAVDFLDDLTAAMPVTMEVTILAPEYDFESDWQESYFEPDWIDMELGPTTLVPDEFSLEVNGTVTNPAEVPLETFTVTCLVVTADGSVVAGALTYPDQVAPGQTVAWDVSVSNGPLVANGVAAECRSIATID